MKNYNSIQNARVILFAILVTPLVWSCDSAPKLEVEEPFTLYTDYRIPVNQHPSDMHHALLDSVRIADHNHKVFSAFLGEVVEKVFSGEIQAYEEVFKQELNKNVITSISVDRLKSLTGKATNTTELDDAQIQKDFLNGFEIYYKFIESEKNMAPSPQWMRLVYIDDSGLRPDMNFCLIKMEDLKGLSFPTGKGKSFSDYVAGLDFERTLIRYWVNDTLVKGIRTFEEAFELQDQVESGKFESIKKSLNELQDHLSVPVG